MIIFADSSAVVKLYINESGSDLVQTIEIPAVSAITRVECTSAIWKRYRERQFSIDDVSVAIRVFENDWNNKEGHFAVYPVTEITLSLACDLVAQHQLRAYDAIQLAQAQLVRSATTSEVRFLSFDKKLNSAARAEGFDLILI